MTREEAKILAWAVQAGLPGECLGRLKAIHIAPRIHQSMLTVRIFMVPSTALDPEPYIFAADEL